MARGFWFARYLNSRVQVAAGRVGICLTFVKTTGSDCAPKAKCMRSAREAPCKGVIKDEKSWERVAHVRWKRAGNEKLSSQNSRFSRKGIQAVLNKFDQGATG